MKDTVLHMIGERTMRVLVAELPSDLEIILFLATPSDPLHFDAVAMSTADAPQMRQIIADWIAHNLSYPDDVEVVAAVPVGPRH